MMLGPSRFVFLALLLQLAACSAVSLPRTTHFTLPPIVLGGGAKPLAHVLRISSFEVAPHLVSETVVSQDVDARIAARPGEAWSAPLGALVTEAVRSGLLEARVFRAVIDDRDAVRSDLVLAGRVEAFEEWRDGGTRQAHVALGLVLAGEERGEILFQQRVAAKVPLHGDDGAALVGGLHKALGEAFRNFLVAAEEAASAWSAPDRGRE